MTNRQIQIINKGKVLAFIRVAKGALENARRFSDEEWLQSGKIAEIISDIKYMESFINESLSEDTS